LEHFYHGGRWQLTGALSSLQGAFLPKGIDFSSERGGFEAGKRFFPGEKKGVTGVCLGGKGEDDRDSRRHKRKNMISSRRERPARGEGGNMPTKIPALCG